jgi:cation transport protein ChaC
MPKGSESDFWVFGYGSLIWRPDIPFAECHPATISGWSRRFWQGSTDHRGVPGDPGRVVTLVKEEGAACWGMAYRVEAGERDNVFAYLDYREKGGYALETMSLSLRDRNENPLGHVYVATPDNPNYLGPADDAEIAETALRSVGPSGPNDEYVLNLADSLRKMNAVDEHVFAVERHLLLLKRR